MAKKEALKKQKLEWKGLNAKIEAFLDDLLIDKAPVLSKKLKDWISSAAPWFSLIFGLLGVFGSLGALGVTGLASPFLVIAGRRLLSFSFVPIVLGLASSVLELLAVSPLFKKSKKGWRFLYYSILLGVVSVFFSFSGIGLVMTAISLYFLFQIKSAYK